MGIFHSYVKLPEGRTCACPRDSDFSDEFWTCPSSIYSRMTIRTDRVYIQLCIQTYVQTPIQSYIYKHVHPLKCIKIYKNWPFWKLDNYQDVSNSNSRLLIQNPSSMARGWTFSPLGPFLPWRTTSIATNGCVPTVSTRCDVRCGWPRHMGSGSNILLLFHLPSGNLT